MYKVLQPQSEDWFRLFPFRSPLLRKSIIFFLFLWLLRCFSSPGYSRLAMNSLNDTCALPQVDSPIRKSPDQSILTAPRSISLFVTSFIIFQCQVIHTYALINLTTIFLAFLPILI
jgi:hypothetical protein